MDMAPYKKMFLEDAAPVRARIETALGAFNTLDKSAVNQLYRDAHTLKGAYLQFEMPAEAAWAADIEKKAYAALQAFTNPINRKS